MMDMNSGVAADCAGDKILAHPNEQKHPRQRVLIVAHDNYADVVPFVEEDHKYVTGRLTEHPAASNPPTKAQAPKGGS